MAETITYLATLTPHFRGTVANKVEGQIKIVLPVLSTTHKTAINTLLSKLAGGSAASHPTEVAAVVTAINALP